MAKFFLVSLLFSGFSATSWADCPGIEERYRHKVGGDLSENLAPQEKFELIVFLDEKLVSSEEAKELIESKYIHSGVSSVKESTLPVLFVEGTLCAAYAITREPFVEFIQRNKIYIIGE